MHEATVDLSAGRVTAWQAVTGEPALLIERSWARPALPAGGCAHDPGLGRTRLYPAQVFCLPLTAGNFGTGEEQGRRLIKVPCVGQAGRLQLLGPSDRRLVCDGRFEGRQGARCDRYWRGAGVGRRVGLRGSRGGKSAPRCARTRKRRALPSRAESNNIGNRETGVGGHGICGASTCAPTSGRGWCSPWSRRATVRAGAPSPSQCICPKFLCPTWTRTRAGTFGPIWTAANTALEIP